MVEIETLQTQYILQRNLKLLFSGSVAVIWIWKVIMALALFWRQHVRLVYGGKQTS